MPYAIALALLGIVVFSWRRVPMEVSFDWPEVRTRASLVAASRLVDYDSERFIRMVEYERNWKRRWEDERRRKYMHVVK